MRLQLHLTPNIQPVPFNHLNQLTGALHKWLGPNQLHDGLSLYSFGWLQGAEKIGKSLYFPQGSTWTISFNDSEQVWNLARGILKDNIFGYGMRVEKAIEIPIPQFTSEQYFFVDGAVVLRQDREDKTREYLLWNNEKADESLTHILKRKLISAGFSGDDLNVKVSFDRSYPRAKTKLVEIKGIKHKGSICPIIVKGTPEAVRFAWLVGAGELTGSGFGGLK